MTPEEDKAFYEKYGYHCGWKRKAQERTEDAPVQ
jgi:hypothetical protein